MLKLRRMKKFYSHAEVLDIVRRHEIAVQKDYKLEAYYKNNNAINRVQKADGKANHHCSNPFAHQIVSTMTSYFASKPIQLTVDDDAIQEQLTEFLRYNDFDKTMVEVTENVGVYGYGAIMTFIDAKGHVRFASVNPTELIVIVNNDILGEIHTVIRTWYCESNDGNDVHYVEVYDDKEVRKFYIDEKEIFNEVVEPHYFNDVPFTLFQANQQGMNFYERVIPLIDSYDLLQSETLNLVSDLSESILLIAGVELDDDMVSQINQLRLLNVSDIEQGLDVRYITKDSPTNEETKQRLRDDIFSLSMVCDINNPNFGEAVSGTSLKIKMSSMEFLSGMMEGYFRLAIRRLIELWGNIVSLTGGIAVEELVKGLQMKFTRNTVSNEAEQIQNALQLSTILSKETVIGLLQDFIIDVPTELERLNTEREENVSFMQDSFNNGHEEEDEEEVKVDEPTLDDEEVE